MFYLLSLGGTWQDPFTEQPPIFIKGKIVNNTPNPAISHISALTPWIIMRIPITKRNTRITFHWDK